MKIPDDVRSALAEQLLIIAVRMVGRRCQDGGIHDSRSAAEELLKEADIRIAAKPEPPETVQDWLTFYCKFMHFIEKERERKWIRKTDRLQTAVRLDDPASRELSTPPSVEGQLMARDFIEKVIDSFCERYQFERQAVLLHIVGRMANGVTVREHEATHPGTSRTTLSRWEVLFRRHALEMWRGEGAPAPAFRRRMRRT